MKRLFTLFLSFVFLIAAHAQQSLELGVMNESKQFIPETTLDNSSYKHLAIDRNGIPYCLYITEFSHKIKVRRRIGNNWEFAGNDINLANPIVNATISIDRFDVPHIAFAEQIDPMESRHNLIWVYKLVGTQWQIVGNAPATINDTAYASFSNLIFDLGNKPILSYQNHGLDPAIGFCTNFSTYNGTSWVNTKRNLCPVELNKISIDTNGRVFALFLNSFSEPYVQLWSNLTIDWGIYSNWHWFPPGSDNNNLIGSIAISKQNKIFVAMAFKSNHPTHADSGIMVWWVNSQSTPWVKVGESIFLSQQITEMDMVLDSNETPYLICRSNLNNGRPSVMKYNGTQWVFVGNQSFTPGSGRTSIALSSKDSIYAFWRSDETSKGDVFKLEGNTWQSNTGTAQTVGLSAGVVNNMVNAVHPINGYTYVLYSDVTKGNYLSCKRFNTITKTWQIVGIEGFSFSAVANPKLVIDQTGQLYTAFPDELFSLKATVLKHDGSTWLPLGTRAFSSGKANHVNLAVDKAGTAYVAYADEFYNNRLVVRRYNGSSWVDLGTPGLSDSIATSISLVIDKNNTPIVAYLDSKLTNRTVVKKWNGTAWVLVGALGITPTNSSNITLTNHDSSNTQMILYKNNNTSKLSVIKYDQGSSNWINVGAVAATDSVGGGGSIGLDKSGNPHIIFPDPAYDDRSSVLKFDGTGWVYYGPRGFSAGNIKSPAIAFTNNNAMVINYGTAQAFARVFAGDSSVVPVGLVPEPIIIKQTATIYPNPNHTGILHMQIAFTDIGKSFSIYDIQGKKRYSGTLTFEENQINLQSFAQGWYFIQIEGSASVYKLLIQK